MKNKILRKRSLITLLFIFCFQLISYKSNAQSKQIDSKEMKDTINQIVSRVRSLEKETSPGKKQIDDLRTKLMALLILNSTGNVVYGHHPHQKLNLLKNTGNVYLIKLLMGKNLSRNDKEC